MIDPEYSTPADTGELSDFATFTQETDELLWVAKNGGTYNYAIGQAPAGTHPAYVAKR